MREKKIVPGYEWLTVDEDGNAWNTRFQRQFNGEIDKYGYKRINTRYKGKRVRCLLHRAVAIAFIPNPDNLPTVNHKNAIKTDNRVENLEWATHQDQADHIFKMKLQHDARVYGENTSNNKYSEETIHDICRLMEIGYKNNEIAELCCVDKHLPVDIRSRKSWKTISSQYNINFTRNRRLSESTVRWVCSKLELGWSTSMILKESTSKSLNQTNIQQIRVRNTFLNISKDYDY